MNYTNLLTALFPVFLLTGCGGFKNLVAEDGGQLSRSGSKVTYSRENTASTSCEYSREVEIWVCEDGTRSNLEAASLPLSFQGVHFAKFDSKYFYSLRVFKIE